MSNESDQWSADFNVNFDYLDELLLTSVDNNNPVPKTETAEPRFGAPLSSAELQRKLYDRIPNATRRNTKWAIGVWDEWLKYRSFITETSMEQVPLPTDLSRAELSDLDFWLSRFIVEARRKDKSQYPPNTLMQISSGIQRHLRDNLGRSNVNIFLKSDPTFANFRNSLDMRMKELTTDGIGIHTQSKDPVLASDESKLWNEGIFTSDTAEGLSNIVFFYNCKAFGFRGVQEHVSLEAEQFSVETDPASGMEYIHYKGRVMKNVQGGLNQRTVSPKQVKHFANPDNDRCLVKIYKLYLSCIPRKGMFYRKPLPVSDKFKYQRFGAKTISQKDLSNMMKKLFCDAGIDTSNRKISNHSGRVSCCTTLYNNGFDDKAVSSRSWHRSSAVNTYKRELEPMLQSISHALDPPPSTTTNNANATETHPPSDIKTSVSNINSTESSLPTIDTKENIINSFAEDMCVLNVPSSVKHILIIKGDKKIKVEL